MPELPEKNKIFFETLKKGDQPTIILINGFLSVRADFNRWVKKLPPELQKNTILGLRWPAHDYLDLGIQSIKKSAKKLSSPENEEMDPRLALVNEDFPKGLMDNLVVSELVLATYEAWELSIKEAFIAGHWLGNYISRSDSSYILMGFSLGTKIINTTLNFLTDKKVCKIKDVYLFGGTARSSRKKSSSDEDWDKCLKALKGKIYNFYSYYDNVLSSLFIKALQVSKTMSKEISLGELNQAKKDLEQYRAYAKFSPSMKLEFSLFEDKDVEIEILSRHLQKIIAQLPRLGLDLNYFWTEEDLEEYNQNLASYIAKHPRLDSLLPIGLPPGIRTKNKIEPRIKNINASDIISGHLQYREYLDLLIERALYLCGDIKI